MTVPHSLNSETIQHENECCDVERPTMVCRNVLVYGSKQMQTRTRDTRESDRKSEQIGESFGFTMTSLREGEFYLALVFDRDLSITTGIRLAVTDVVII
jgi:hypothetical protein